MMTAETVLQTNLAGVPLFKRGKVRDVYDLGQPARAIGSGAASDSRSHDLGEHLLIVATDRISAFDVVLPTGIPSKGYVLTALSAFWFERMKGLVPSHFVSCDIQTIVRSHPALAPFQEMLSGRSMLVVKSEVVPIECVVRGFLSGSGWKEYQKKQSVCGVPLPAGLRESEELAEPIFTPATKEESGHDINISEAEMARRVGEKLTAELKRLSLAIYTKARDYTKGRGIIIADTKFEFGLQGDQVLLIDELLTPDSSRFWPSQSYAPGKSQASFDKQFVRDYLETLDWDKTPPGPELPQEIVQKTSAKYLQALEQLI